MSEITEILDEFRPITLDEMESVKLMDRVDTKFLLKTSEFPKVLRTLKTSYQCLEVNGVRASEYATMYLDSADLDFYLKHHNGKRNRHKVRFRKYVESDLTFLEVKFKNNKKRTVKNRVVVDDIEHSLSADSLHFIKEISGISHEIQNVLANNFHRITLVNTERKERLTLDLNVTFKGFGGEAELGDVMICELKQEKANRNSPFFAAIKSCTHRAMRISKYCMGIVMLNANVKKNNFKENLLILEKFNDDFRAA